MKSKNKIMYYLFISAVSFIFLIIISMDYIIKGKFGFDSSAINFAVKMSSSKLDIFFKILTVTGNPITVTFITAAVSLFLVIYKKLKKALFLALSVLGIWIINEIMKFAFKRPRPALKLRMVNANGYSFPSGHAMVFTGFIIILVYLIAESAKHKALSLISSTCLILFAVLVGLSRVYLRVHYLSDVLAGFSAGTSLACLSIAVFNFKEINK